MTTYTIDENQNTISGGNGTDIFQGLGGGNGGQPARGNGGNDLFNIENAQTGLIDGGAGHDRVHLQGAGYNALDAGLTMTGVEELIVDSTNLMTTRRADPGRHPFRCQQWRRQLLLLPAGRRRNAGLLEELHRTPAVEHRSRDGDVARRDHRQRRQERDPRLRFRRLAERRQGQRHRPRRGRQRPHQGWVSAATRSMATTAGMSMCSTPPWQPPMSTISATSARRTTRSASATSRLPVDGPGARRAEAERVQGDRQRPGAIDADDHILYNQNTGAVYYDADGPGKPVRPALRSPTISPVTFRF